jgi:hypothetical protein
MRNGLDDRWFESQQGLGIILHHRVQTDSGAHPASHPMCTKGFSLGVKWLGREADHSSPSRAEVKNARSYTSTTPLCFHGMMVS